MKANENLHYVGSFTTLQTQGPNYLMDYGTKYTVKQQELYYRLLKGLKVYTPEELYTMNSTKKRRISDAHSKAQNIINLYKQEIMLAKTNNLLEYADKQIVDFTSKFKDNTAKAPQSFTRNVTIKNNESLSEVFTVAALKTLLSTEVSPDPTFICNLSFKDLGISKEDIVKKFKQVKLLPANFDVL